MTFSSIPKKLPFSLQPKPFGLINKKINMNTSSTNPNNNYNNNNNHQNIMSHNLPKYYQKKNNENISLLDKIKDKVNKEKNDFQLNSLNINNEKIFNLKAEKNINQKKIINEDIWDNGINENVVIDKKENNEEEEDLLSEEVDEMGENDDSFNSINKISSINIHPNFIKDHYNCGSGFSMNSNNSNSNNSTSRQKTSFIEGDESLKNYLNPPSSGRSNNSGSTNLAQGSQAPGGSSDNNSNFVHGLYGQNRGIGYPFKSSFLSTNTNSHSGQKLLFDSSLSNESQSPHYLETFHRLQYNNSMANIGKTNTFMFPFTGFTPINTNRHIYTSRINSNESLFKQPFSLNKKTFTSNFNSSKREKQVINLEDVALGKEKRTTVMIRNVPIKYTDKVLESELQQFKGKYNCLYMPFDFENGGNKGYAFLNLTSPYHVLLFYEVFYNKCWMYFESKKICELNYAVFQGIDEIKKHANNYKGSKKPNYYPEDKSKDIIEIPSKYLHLLLKANPEMKFVENKQTNMITVKSFK